MKLSILREDLLKPLQLVTAIVEKRQTIPILSNVLLKVDKDLSVIATDLEVELIVNIPLSSPSVSGEVTIPSRKLMDLCRALPINALINFSIDSEKCCIQSGRSRFTLATLPASEYPRSEQTENTVEFSIEQKKLRALIHRTCFAMAQQDVRYYLNGMLLEIKQGIIRSVATDGHRLALNTLEATLINNIFSQVIIPRKGVTELMRLLEDTINEVTVSIMTNHITVSNSNFTFISKLIDGRFPDYERALPKGGDKVISLSRDVLKHSLIRASILSNEKLRGVQIQLRNGILRILANNPDREEAEEEIHINYSQDDLDIGFNVKYLTDIFDNIDDDTVTMTFSNANNSVLIEGNLREGNSLFVVMPMRL